MNTAFIEEGKNAITEALLSGKGIPEIFSAAGAFIPNPILLSDGSFRVVASVNTQYPDDRFLAEIVGRGYYPEDYVQRLQDGAPISANLTPTLVEGAEQGAAKHYMTVDIALLDRFWGFLTMVEETPFRPEEKELFRYLSRVVRTELRAGHFDAKARPKSQLQDYVLQELLEKALSGATLDARLKQAGISFLYGKRILRITNPYGVNNPVRLEYQIDTVRRLVGNKPCILYDESILALLDEIPNGGTAPAILSALEEYLNQTGLLGGISNPSEKPSDVRLMDRQARAALVFGQFISQEGTLFHYETLAIYNMIDVVSRLEPLENFCSPHYMYMCAHDRQFGTAYAPTMVAYLECALDPAKTAAKMNLHRNTVVYRIKRIEDIFHFDFDNPDQVFAAMLTIRIMRTFSSLDPEKRGTMQAQQGERQP